MNEPGRNEEKTSKKVVFERFNGTQLGDGGGGLFHTSNLPYHHFVSSYWSRTLYIFYEKPLLKILLLPNCSVLFLCPSQDSSNLQKPKSSLHNYIMTSAHWYWISSLVNDFILLFKHADSGSLWPGKARRWAGDLACCENCRNKIKFWKECEEILFRSLCVKK